MVSIITGGTRGIGLGIAKRLLRLGHTCIVSSRNISVEVQNLMGHYSNLHFVPADISINSDRQNLINFAVALGDIDLLVNNAGVAPKVRTDMLDIDEDAYDYVMDINLKGTYFMTQLVAKTMANQKFGRIINISSMSSFTSSTMRAEYCISKAGVSMITKLFADRMAEFNVGVFEIAPGIILTDMTTSVKEKYSKLIDDGITPIKRFGAPDDIAKCIESIATGNLDFCTGTIINCDGGFSVRRL